MMNDQEILNEFKKRYGKLRKFGLQIHGIGNLAADHNVISVSTPLIFDHRELPKKFMGLPIRNSVSTYEMPPEFQITDNENEYIWAYQRFEAYVDNNADIIRSKLGKPDMTRDEMLDALCFGDFRRHKEMCIDWENKGKIPKWRSKK